MYIGNPSVYTTTGLKRTPAVTAVATKALGSQKVQEAIVDKGIEVVGKAIDKQIANIEGAQNKSEAFLNNRVMSRWQYSTELYYCNIHSKTNWPFLHHATRT